MLTVLLGFGSLDAWARPPRAREQCGVLEHIDRETRALAIRRSKECKLLQLAWTRRTKFIWNGEFDSSNSLEEGGYICVYYRSPFFGKPFVTKVTWKNREVGVQSNPPGQKLVITPIRFARFGAAHEKEVSDQVLALPDG